MLYICRYDYTLFTACETLANKWLAGADLPQDSVDFDQFSTNQKVSFLTTLVLKVTLNRSLIEVYKTEGCLLFSWLQIEC